MASILLGLVMGLCLLVYSALPAVFQGLGLHGEVAAPSPYNIQGRKALIITTSQNQLKPTDQATGVWASELTTPYYLFQDAGLKVELASIQGGKIPLEPGSADWPLASVYDQRMNRDPHLRQQLQHAMPLAEINVSDYDLIFIAGGWGAAYDLGQSQLLGQKVSEAFAQKKIQGSVCHGPLGWLKAHKPNGEPLLKGTRVTGVSNRQLEELGISFTIHALRPLPLGRGYKAYPA